MLGGAGKGVAELEAMRHLEVRAIHGVPAFGIAVLTGSAAGGVVLGGAFLLFESSFGLASAAFVGALAWGALFGITGGLIFFPVFFLLRALRLLNQWSLPLIGGVALALIGVASQVSALEVAMFAVSGIVAGYSAFITLASCARRDAEGAAAG